MYLGKIRCYLPDCLFLQLDDSHDVEFFGRCLVGYIQGLLERLQLTLQRSRATLHFFDTLPEIGRRHAIDLIGMSHLAIQKFLETTVEFLSFLFVVRCGWCRGSSVGIPILVLVVGGEGNPDPRGNEFGGPFCVANGLSGTGFVHFFGVHHAAVQAPELVFQLLYLAIESLHGNRQWHLLSPSSHIGLLSRLIQ